MEELNLQNARKLDPKLRMHLLTKKILIADQQSRIMRDIHGKATNIMIFAFIAPFSLYLTYQLFHPHGAVHYMYSAAGQYQFGVYQCMTPWKSMRERFRPEMFERERQPQSARLAKKEPDVQRARRFFTWN